jgi:hypothetical protein
MGVDKEDAAEDISNGIYDISIAKDFEEKIHGKQCQQGH